LWASSDRLSARAPDTTDARPWRLFVALAVPATAAEQLWHALAGLRDRHREARWLPLEQYHLTLVFLGATDPRRVAPMVERLGSVAAEASAFEVDSAGAGGIAGGRRGGVAWLRLAAGRDEVARLSLAVDAALGSNVYGANVKPRPHLTVARRVDEGLLADLRAVADRLTFAWRTDQLTLFRSHTGPAGARYENLADFPLRRR
jgi:2'-5' RNA ligase